MNIIETPIEGVKIIEPKVFGDARGYFFESWNKAAFAAAGIEADFVQDNESFSTYGVLRGLHYQMPPYTQAKLVRVIEGTVLDIVVDIRKGSPTFGRNVAVELSGENKRQLFVPRGFAHGFVVLSDDATTSTRRRMNVRSGSTIRNSASTGRFRRKITCCRRRTAKASRSTKPNICNGEN